MNVKGIFSALGRVIRAEHQPKCFFKRTYNVSRDSTEFDGVEEEGVNILNIDARWNSDYASADIFIIRGIKTDLGSVKVSNTFLEFLEYLDMREHMSGPHLAFRTRQAVVAHCVGKLGYIISNSDAPETDIIKKQFEDSVCEALQKYEAKYPENCAKMVHALVGDASTLHPMDKDNILRKLSTILRSTPIRGYANRRKEACKLQ